MKRLILTPIALLMVLFANSQYTPLAVQGNTWKVRNYGLLLFDYEYSIGPDSVYNSVIYKTLWVHYDQQEPIVAGLLIEDTYTQSVYILQADQLILLYDFSLEVGESASVSGAGGMHNIVVSDVSSVIVNGTTRKKITFTEDMAGGGYWIEGIGSVYGVPDAALGLIMDYLPQVTCFYSENNLAWSNPNIADIQCEAQLSTVDLSMESISIYPNPASDEIRLSSTLDLNGGKLSCMIYNSEGQMLSSTNNFAYSIDISELSDGLYFLLVQNETGTQLFKSFMKSSN
jgi:hypothetical protein